MATMNLSTQRDGAAELPGDRRPPRAHRRRTCGLLFLVLLSLASLAGAAGNWKLYNLPEQGTFFERYLPDGLDPQQPAPLIVFLHGSSTLPLHYRSFVAPSADAAGAILVLPKSQSALGWGFAGDQAAITAAIDFVRGLHPIDGQRIAIAGHSAGGAYSYLLAYLSDLHFSAVFSLSAPFRPVTELARDDYVPPIRMYYGASDPNYTDGAYDELRSQWAGLGIRFEEEIREGYGHNNWPQETMDRGFQFLVAERDTTAETSGGGVSGAPTEPSSGLSACEPSDEILCLGDNRFEVGVTWRDFNGTVGSGKVVSFGSADSGLFWFFDANNWELLVKVLDGCGVNGHYWVFAAATTNVEYQLQVVDRATGHTASYENPLGQRSIAITDDQALPGCP